MPHEDGPSYHPTTATVSLGSYTVLEVYMKNENGEREPTSTWRLLQEPRSLLVTTGTMYTDTLHGISELETDAKLDPGHIANWNLIGNTIPYMSSNCKRDTRISLTFRDVKKVAKLGGAMKFLAQP
jgi:alkylated DNA repair protein alkB family protein 6